MKRRAARWEAEHCDFEVLAWISHLIEPERGSERLCVRTCLLWRRPKNGIGDVLVIGRG